MVAEEADGTRRIYHLQSRGVARRADLPRGRLGRGGRPVPAAGREHRTHRHQEPPVTPLTLSFDVDCSVEHAFTIWTDEIGTWWPRDHTVTGGGSGGRPAERRRRADLRAYARRRRARLGRGDRLGAAQRRLAYLWHLAPRPGRRDRRSRSASCRGATTRPGSRSSTAAGSASAPRGDQWRERNQIGWESLLPHFVAAVDERRRRRRQLVPRTTRGCSRPRPASRSTRCSATRRPTRRRSSARSGRRR